MLQRSFHGWRIEQEIQKVTAIRTPSPHLNPVRVSPTRPTPLSLLSPFPPLFFYRQKNLRPTAHFPITPQTTRFPLSTSSVGVDDGMEHDGDSEGSGGSRSGVVLTCMSEDGECHVYIVEDRSKGEVTGMVTLVMPEAVTLQPCPDDVGTLELLKRNRKVVNELEVDPGDEFRVACEEAMKYGGKAIPGDGPEQFENAVGGPSEKPECSSHCTDPDLLSTIYSAWREGRKET